MHQLSGNAGMLGATAVRRVAGGVEAACCAGELERIASPTSSLSTPLRALRRAAAHGLADRPEEASPVQPVSDDAVELQALALSTDLLTWRPSIASTHCHPVCRVDFGPCFDWFETSLDHLSSIC